MANQGGFPGSVDFQLVFESFPVMCVLLDPTFRIVDITDGLLASTKTRREDVVGKVLYEAYPDNPDDPTAEGAANLRASLERVRDSLEPDRMPVQKYDVRRPDSEGGGFEERYWTPMNSPVVRDGRLVFIVHRVEDITAYVRMTKEAEQSGDRAAQLQTQAQVMEAELLSRREEVAQASRRLKDSHAELERLYLRARELDELKSSFFANVSHELRTPLTLILGPTRSVLADPELPEGHRRRLEVVQRNATELLDRVNDLLEATRLEAGRVPVSYADVDLAELVRLTAGQFETVVADRGTTLSVVTPDHVPAQVDPDKVHRILLNLIGNAVKFSPDRGTIRVQLSAPPGGDEVRIEVADNGPGVPEDQRDRVFERFHQVSSDLRRTHGGTGLGLAIARDLAHLQRGSVGVEAAPEGGASFWVSLPASAPAGAAVSPAPAFRPKPVPVPVPAPRRAPDVVSVEPLSLVLVVDDQPEMRQFLADELAEVARVVAAADGAEGLTLARELVPDLVITDLMMPVLSGDLLLREIRADPRLSAIPVVLLTAKTDDELRVQLLREGASDYLMKPFFAEELRARVSNLLELHALHRALRDASLHDPLTGLANRLLLLDHLELGLAELGRSGGHVGLLYLDLDGFKEVNDRYGHAVGDTFLQETARRLTQVVRPGDTVARLGGDEFVILCPDLDGPGALESLARRVSDAVGVPSTVGERELVVQASIGMALTASRGDSADALLDAADRSMYEAKRRRGPKVVESMWPLLLPHEMPVEQG